MLKDGWYFTPDGPSEFEVKDGVAYFETGEVITLQPGTAIRCMEREPGEKYSEWSAEHRATVLAKFQAEVQAEQDQSTKEYEQRAALRESAKTKLTDDEYEACCYPEYG